jgi:hypothetical protein
MIHVSPLENFIYEILLSLYFRQYCF